MADQNYFFTQNYLYLPDAVVTASSNAAGGEDNVFDYDMETYWESNDPPASPCYINLDFGTTGYECDTIWIKTDNVTQFKWYYYSGGWVLMSTVDVSSDHTLEIHGSPQTSDQWRVEITGTSSAAYIYEIFLMKHLHTQQVSDDSVPSNIIVTPVDRIGGNYTLVDGSETSYRGIKIHHDITFEYEFTPQANRDDLYDIYYSTTYGIRPNIVIYPDEDNYPEGIYRVVWESIDFPFTYTIPYKGSGFSGTLNFKEY